jgi:serine/threonine-protein kinase ULK/ATG1
LQYLLPASHLQADLWSIGTILYELLVGKPPFTGANHMQLLRNIERGEARLPEAVAGRLSPACKGLLGRLLQRNPVERITFEEFFQHPFLSGAAGAPMHVLHVLPSFVGLALTVLEVNAPNVQSMALFW